MKGFCKVQLMGNVVRDPELRTTNSGKNVSSFTVAVNTKGNDGDADFIRCVAWEKTGELIAQYFVKGKPIIIDGYLSTQKYEKDGERRESTEVVVRDFYFLPSAGRQDEDRPLTQNEVLEKSGDFVPTDRDIDKPIDLSKIPF